MFCRLCISIYYYSFICQKSSKSNVHWYVKWHKQFWTKNVLMNNKIIWSWTAKGNFGIYFRFTCSSPAIFYSQISLQKPSYIIIMNLIVLRLFNRLFTFTVFNHGLLNINTRTCHSADFISIIGLYFSYKKVQFALPRIVPEKLWKTKRKFY
jgi:hypothetical protein